MINQQGKTVLALILLIFILVVGSFYIGRLSNKNISNSPGPVIPSPVSISSSVPEASEEAEFQASPAANVKPDTEIKQESGSKKYINNKYKLSYNFPNSLTLNNSVSDSSFAQFLEYQQGSGNVARMVMQIFQNPTNSSLDEVIKREGVLNNHKDLGPKYEYSTIDGHEAVKLTKVMTQNEMCNDGVDSTKNRVFNFLVKGDRFVFEIHPNQSCESFKRDWFDITPSSFRFTN